jgi:hypothetical protein
MAAGTRKAKKKSAKRKARSEIYRESYPETLKILVVESGQVNRKGEIAWNKIGKILGVSVATMRLWRNRLITGKPNKHYKPAFAAAAVACVEEVELARIKRTAITLSQPHVVKKTIKEERETPDGTITVDRVEKQYMLGDLAAVKLCAANLGPKEGRWTDKHQVDVADARLSETEVDEIREILGRNIEAA